MWEEIEDDVDTCYHGLPFDVYCEDCEREYEEWERELEDEEAPDVSAE